MPCEAPALIAQSVAFAGLGNGMNLDLAMIALLQDWAATANPGADLSPAALIERSKQFAGSVGSPQVAEMVIIQLLCNIRG